MYADYFLCYVKAFTKSLVYLRFFLMLTRAGDQIPCPYLEIAFDPQTDR